MKKYRILSCDGGGIRGIFSAQLLNMIEKEVPFLSKIDLFTGTSTGALLALSFAGGFSPEQAVGLYQHLGPVLFPSHLEKSPSKAKYNSSFFKQLMIDQVFPNNPKLSDLPKKVAILAFKLSKEKRWQPHIFHNYTDIDGSAYLIDAALSSSAAPLYFASYQGYVDGGVFAANPSMTSLCLALEYLPELKLSDFRLFSIGTGLMPDHINEDINWGPEQWLSEKKPSDTFCDYPLFSIFTEGGVCAVDHQCKVLLKDYYFRINEEMENSVALDAIEYIPYLLQKALMLPKKHPSTWSHLLQWIEKQILS